MFMILIKVVGLIGALHQVILDHQDMIEVTPAVHTVILLLLGKDATQGQLFNGIIILSIYVLWIVLLMLPSVFCTGQFHLEIRDVENGLTQGRPMAQGVQAGALVGAGAKVWTILGDWFEGGWASMYPGVFLHVSCLDDLSLGLYQQCEWLQSWLFSF